MAASWLLVEIVDALTWRLDDMPQLNRVLKSKLGSCHSPTSSSARERFQCPVSLAAIPLSSRLMAAIMYIMLRFEGESLSTNALQSCNDSLLSPSSLRFAGIAPHGGRVSTARTG